MRKPEEDPWARAKWSSDRPTRKGGAGTRALALLFMIPVGAVVANVLVLMLFGKFWSLGYGIFVGLPTWIPFGAIAVIGAVLGALSVLLYWPTEED